jgi:hypothetical protein
LKDGKECRESGCGIFARPFPAPAYALISLNLWRIFRFTAPADA